MTSGSENGRGAVREPLVRGHPVSVGRQLAAGLEAAIRDGHLPPGARLPSTRDLARRLGIHRGTVNAAYARLRRRGCVEGRERGRLAVGRDASWPETTRPRPERWAPSSGVTTAPRLEPPAARALASECVAATLGRAVSAGVARREVLAALGRTLADLGETPALVPLLVEPRPGLRRALAAELAVRLGVEVAAARGLPPGGHAAPVLARPEVLARLDARTRGRSGPGSAPNGPLADAPRSGEPGPAGTTLELVPLPLAGGTRERGLVRRSVGGGVVALVSVSATVRRHARELAAREFERGVSFTALDPSDRADVVRAVDVARLVLHDEASRDALPRTAVPRVAIRLVPPGPLAAIRGYLGLDPDAPTPRRQGGKPVRRDRRGT